MAGRGENRIQNEEVHSLRTQALHRPLAWCRGPGCCLCQTCLLLPLNIAAACLSSTLPSCLLPLHLIPTLPPTLPCGTPQAMDSPLCSSPPYLKTLQSSTGRPPTVVSEHHISLILALSASDTGSGTLVHV